MWLWGKRKVAGVEKTNKETLIWKIFIQKRPRNKLLHFWLGQLYLFTFWIAVPDGVIFMLQFKWACVKIIRKRKTVACLLVEVLWPGFCVRIRPLAGLTTFWWIEIFVSNIDSLQTDSCSPCVIFFKLIPRLYFTCGSTSKLLHRSLMFESWKQIKSLSNLSPPGKNLEPQEQLLVQSEGAERQSWADHLFLKNIETQQNFR